MITVTALGLMAALAQAAPCESLRTFSLPNTTITSAQLVAAGPYVAPAPAGLPEARSWLGWDEAVTVPPAEPVEARGPVAAERALERAAAAAGVAAAVTQCR